MFGVAESKSTDQDTVSPTDKFQCRHPDITQTATMKQHSTILLLLVASAQSYYLPGLAPTNYCKEKSSGCEVSTGQHLIFKVVGSVQQYE